MTKARGNQQVLVGDNIHIHESFDVLSPVSETLLHSVSLTTPEDIDFFLKTVNTYQSTWSQVPISKKQEILNQWAALLITRQAELIKIAKAETAKTAAAVQAEIHQASQNISELIGTYQNIVSDGYDFQFFSPKTDNFAHYRYLPLGVVLVVAPFNYPISTSVLKITSALLCGNCVIFKPASQTSMTALFLIDLLRQAGLPNDALKIILATGSSLGNLLWEHELIKAINFTGSSKIGQTIQKLAWNKRLLLELGGKDVALVLSDCDLNNAVEQIVNGAFRYNGQRCTALKIVCVHQSLLKSFKTALLTAIKHIKVGDDEPNAMITSLINRSAVNYLKTLIQDALAKKAQLWVGNKWLNQDRLLLPTVFEVQDLSTRLLYEEQFGPVLPVYVFDSLSELQPIFAGNKYGLQGAIFSNNINEVIRATKLFQTGVINVNQASSRSPDYLPFFGIKASGVSEQGHRASILMNLQKQGLIFNILEKANA